MDVFASEHENQRNSNKSIKCPSYKFHPRLKNDNCVEMVYRFSFVDKMLLFKKFPTVRTMDD